MHRPVASWGGVIAAVALVAACDGAKAPPPAPPPPQVTVVTVKPQSVVIRTALPGRTAPTLIAEVRPQVTGIVQSRTFNEGAEVKAGSTLYKLDPATYQAAYESARAALAKAVASPARLVAGLIDEEQKRQQLAALARRIRNKIEAEIQPKIDAEKLLSAQREACPPQYRELVNKYYEALSNVKK